MLEFAAAVDPSQVVLVPIGATEAHGRHLPLDTDTWIASEVCRLASLKARALVAPAIPFGVCRSSGRHPGTIGISTETLKGLVQDVVGALYRQGLRRFILLSGHAGGTHNAALVDIGETLLERLEDIRLAVVCEHQMLVGVAAALIDSAEDSHAGEIETSRLLHSCPERVRQPFSSPERPAFERWELVRDKQGSWPGAVWGDPDRATAVKGKKLEEAVVAELAALIERLREGEV